MKSAFWKTAMAVVAGVAIWEVVGRPLVNSLGLKQIFG